MTSVFEKNLIKLRDIALELAQYGIPTYTDRFNNDRCIYCDSQINVIITHSGKNIIPEHPESCLWIRFIRLVHKFFPMNKLNPSAAKYAEDA